MSFVTLSARATTEDQAAARTPRGRRSKIVYVPQPVFLSCDHVTHVTVTALGKHPASYRVWSLKWGAIICSNKTWKGAIRAAALPDRLTGLFWKFSREKERKDGGRGEWQTRRNFSSTSKNLSKERRCARAQNASDFQTFILKNLQKSLPLWEIL